ncbi:hypothetical protein KIW84_051986 [Lathyrus oleraceus]|uniref:Retrovirus-related Pol polyprotein from transposon TNT 1-94-like beta-barrel domain-containing protein n=1 Tax=Pisum sativum TaxID=3888 RepID=A0A9D4WNW5_PEA|nr:hypothetical protein KIW84_051986 [Pisum sativum]
MRITRIKEDEVVAKIVGVDEDVEEKEEAITTTTLTMEKEVGIQKQQEVVEEEIHGQSVTNHKSSASTTTRSVIMHLVVEKVNFVEEKGGEEETFLLACQNQVEEKINKWYLDTGVSNHMYSDRSMFVEINEATTGNVSFGDDSKIPVKGKVVIVQLVEHVVEWRLRAVTIKSDCNRVSKERYEGYGLAVKVREYEDGIS